MPMFAGAVPGHGSVVGVGLENWHVSESALEEGGTVNVGDRSWGNSKLVYCTSGVPKVTVVVNALVVPFPTSTRYCVSPDAP